MGIFGFGKKKEVIKGKVEDKKKDKKETKREPKKESQRKIAPSNNVQKAETKITDKEKTNKDADSDTNSVSDKDKKKTASLPSEKPSDIAHRVLMEPRVTEKSHDLMASNKYVFKVTREANKKSVKKAIEELYGVNVIKVNIINIPPKKRTYARKVGWKSGYKKAITTLKEGDRIELFEGA